MSYKFFKFNNTKLISTLKKYSNIELFSRREKDLLQKKNSNKIIPTKLNNNNNKISINKNLSKFALETISSFKSSFDFLTTQTESFSPKNRHVKSIHAYNSTMTEFNTCKKPKNLKRNKVFSTNDIKKHNNNIIINYNKSETRFNTISSSKPILCIKEKDNKIDLLKQLQMESIRKGKKINKKFLSLMNCKQKKFRVKKYSMQDMLNQTRHLMLFKLANKMKHEMNMRMEENYQNKLEYIDDKINSLKIGNNLHDIKFSNKLTEYVKYILYYREKEKKKCDVLANNINNYKKEILLLQNKIKKEKLERDNILRWIYFQIKMKEKTLILPEYYKRIIETNIKRPQIRMKTTAVQVQDLKMLRNSQRLQHTNSIKNINNQPPEPKRSSKNLTFINYHIKNTSMNNSNDSNYKNKRHKTHKNTILEKNKIINTQNNIINHKGNYFDENLLNKKNLEKIYKNLGDEGIDEFEINRITQYKLFLIYSTPEEFEDRLRELENENIQLLNQYNVLQKYLNEEKREYNQILEERAESEIININYIKEKEYELKEIIKRNEVLKNIIIDMKKGKYFKKKNNDNNIKTNNIHRNKIKLRNNNNNISISISPFSISKDLYLRIENLYNKCKMNDSAKKEKEKEKKKKTNNYKEEIIHMLSYIEWCIDRLKNKFRIYNRYDYPNHDLLKKIKNDIEKKHKVEKAELLRLKEKEKFLKFQEEVSNKMNRIIFIQRRKINTEYNLNNLEKYKNYNSDGENKRELAFEDFMFDKDDFINFQNHY